VCVAVFVAGRTGRRETSPAIDSGFLAAVCVAECVAVCVAVCVLQYALQRERAGERLRHGQGLLFFVG